MSASDLPYLLHALLIAAVLLLWFHFGWSRYAIDSGQDAILTLRGAWWDLVISNPEWQRNAACRAFTRVLEELAASLPRCSLGLAVMVWLTGLRHLGGSNISDVVIANLPDGKLRERARDILDAALVAVGTTMLRQSILALLLFLLAVPVALIAILAATIVHRGLPGLRSLRAVIARDMRDLMRPALLCAFVIGIVMAARESGPVTTKPRLTVVEMN
jgi:hypothetical protein